jgi:hypothetical protein
MPLFKCVLNDATPFFKYIEGSDTTFSNMLNDATPFFKYIEGSDTTFQIC